jgi:hypothetical protein
MSRHSQVIQARKALQNAPRPAQAQSQQQQVGIEALIPLLMQNGAKPGFALQTNDWEKAIRIVAVCGPVTIPLDVPYGKAREVISALTDALEKYDPTPVKTGEGTAAELLAEATQNLKGDYDADDDDLTFELRDPDYNPNTDLGYTDTGHEGGLGDFDEIEEDGERRIIRLS